MAMKAEIERLALCAICSDPFEEPRQLGCLHTFCTVCLVRWHAQRALSWVVCPTCNTCTLLPVNGVYGLPKDFKASNLSEIVKNTDASDEVATVTTKSNNKSDTCESCSNSGSEYICNDCKITLCDQCKTKHEASEYFRDHVIINTRDNCPRHRRLPVTIVCMTCDGRPACISCVPEHEGHDIVSLKQAAGDLKSALLGKARELREKRVGLPDICHSEMFLSLHTAEQRGRAYFQEIRKKIQKEETMFLQLLAKERQQLTQQRDDYEEQQAHNVEIDSLLQYVDDKLPSFSHIEVINTCPGLLTSALKLIGTDPSECDVVYKCYDIDTNTAYPGKDICKLKVTPIRYALVEHDLEDPAMTPTETKGTMPECDTENTKEKDVVYVTAQKQVTLPLDVVFVGHTMVYCNAEGVYTDDGVSVERYKSGQMEPRRLAVTPEQYVAFTCGAQRCVKVISIKTKKEVERFGKFHNPWALGINNKNDWAVGDKGKGNRCVIKLFMEDGETVDFGAQKDNQPLALRSIFSIKWINNERLAASDYEAQRVIIYNTLGEVLSTVDTSTARRTLIPEGLCVSPQGTLYVSDMARHCVYEVSTEVPCLRMVVQPGQGGLKCPYGLDILPGGKRIAVCSNKGHKIHIFPIK